MGKRCIICGDYFQTEYEHQLFCGECAVAENNIQHCKISNQGANTKFSVEDVLHFFFNYIRDPFQWKPLYRKLFVVFIPITGPIWLCYMLFLLVLAVIIMLLLAPIILLINIYEGPDDENSTST